MEQRRLELYDFIDLEQVKIVLFSGETLIVDTGGCTDSYDDEDEDEQTIDVTRRSESPDWPYEYDTMILTDKNIKSIEKL